MLPVCQTKNAIQTPGHPILWKVPQVHTEGKFVAVPYALSLTEATDYCTAQYSGLASIHSALEQSQANSACSAIAPPNAVDGTPHGCWIGALSSRVVFYLCIHSIQTTDNNTRAGAAPQDTMTARSPVRPAVAQPTFNGWTAQILTLLTGHRASQTTTG